MRDLSDHLPIAEEGKGHTITEQAEQQRHPSRAWSGSENPNQHMDIADIVANEKILKKQIGVLKRLQTRHYGNSVSLEYKDAHEQIQRFMKNLQGRTQHHWNQMVESTNKKLSEACGRIKGDIEFWKASQGQ